MPFTPPQPHDKRGELESAIDNLTQQLEELDAVIETKKVERDTLLRFKAAFEKQLDELERDKESRQ